MPLPLQVGHNGTDELPGRRSGSRPMCRVG
jgi:hypothetical protein